MKYGLCIHVNVGPSQTFSKKYSKINAKNLQYNVHVILAGMYIKKKVYLKNTNMASIKKITDFRMILRPYKLLVIAKVQDGDTPVNVDPCAVQGLNIWVKPEPHIRWA